VKGWKKRFFALYGEGEMYHLTYSDSPRERVKGTIDGITVGVSTVAETNKSIKKPFSFVLHVDPSLHNAPVLYAAALTAEDFKKWMSALKAATIHPQDTLFMSRTNISSEAQLEADMELAHRMYSASMSDLNHDDADAQIEADHLIAMRLSVQNHRNQAYG
jgi:PH domain